MHHPVYSSRKSR